MTIDLNRYRINVPLVESWIKFKKDKDPADLAGELAIATNVPIIAILHYIGETVGFSDKINADIESLKKFYGITQIIGKK